MFLLEAEEIMLEATKYFANCCILEFNIVCNDVKPKGFKILY